VRTPNFFTPEQVAALEAKLPTQQAEKTGLHIRSVLTKEATRSGYLHQLPPMQSTDDTDKIGQ
jgi:hypothetical protein